MHNYYHLIFFILIGTYKLILNFNQDNKFSYGNLVFELPMIEN
jgi:hypothetical protein